MTRTLESDTNTLQVASMGYDHVCHIFYVKCSVHHKDKIKQLFHPIFIEACKAMEDELQKKEGDEMEELIRKKKAEIAAKRKTDGAPDESAELDTSLKSAVEAAKKKTEAAAAELEKKRAEKAAEDEEKNERSEQHLNLRGGEGPDSLPCKMGDGKDWVSFETHESSSPWLADESAATVPELEAEERQRAAIGGPEPVFEQHVDEWATVETEQTQLDCSGGHTGDTKVTSSDHTDSETPSDSAPTESRTTDGGQAKPDIDDMAGRYMAALDQEMEVLTGLDIPRLERTLAIAKERSLLSEESMKEMELLLSLARSYQALERSFLARQESRRASRG